jgi:NCS1 nucleoside transporter family
MDTTDAAASAGSHPAAEQGVVEVHSIDYVPLAERHGRVWYQGPFWFMGNFVLATLAVGFIGPELGLSLSWTILAILIGCLFGTFFMAFHAVQGPRMGLPQMIQSRAQFGYQGAVFPLLAVVFVYVGFNVFDTVFAAQGLDTLANAGKWVWYPLITVLAIAIAVVGHDLLHFVQRWLSYLSILVFGIFTIGALTTLDLHHAASAGGFSGTLFLLQIGVCASYQISYAPYVSDYSRYLPERTRAWPVIWWVYAGAATSAIWLMLLGALIGAGVASFDPLGTLRSVGNDFVAGFGTFIVLVTVPANITVMAVNMYGAMLTGATAIDAFRQQRPTIGLRVVGVAAIGIIGFVVALAIPTSFLTSFNNFLLLMLYFLVPWTAVNLVDFYFVRRGHYAITEIFNPSGLYGRWGWRGVTAYFVGLAAMVPFMSTTIWTGPAASAMSGADISFLIGLPVAGGLYYLLTRNLDLEAERAAEQESRRVLEGAATVPATAPAMPSPDSAMPSPDSEPDLEEQV